MAATSELPNQPASPARARASTTRGAAEAALTVLWHLHRSARRRRRWPGVDTTEGRRSVPLLSTARTMSPCAHDRAHLPLHTHSLKRGTAPNADGAARAQDKHRCHVAARREGWAQEHGASSHAIKRMAASRRAHTIAPCLPRSFPRRTRGQLPPAGARHSLRRVVFCLLRVCAGKSAARWRELTARQPLAHEYGGDDPGMRCPAADRARVARHGLHAADRERRAARTARRPAA